MPCEAVGKSVIAENMTMWFIWQQESEYESLSDPLPPEKKNLFKKNSGHCPIRDLKCPKVHFLAC